MYRNQSARTISLRCEFEPERVPSKDILRKWSLTKTSTIDRRLKIKQRKHGQEIRAQFKLVVVSPHDRSLDENADQSGSKVDGNELLKSF